MIVTLSGYNDYQGLGGCGVYQNITTEGIVIGKVIYLNSGKVVLSADCLAKDEIFDNKKEFIEVLIGCSFRLVDLQIKAKQKRLTQSANTAIIN